MHSLLNYALIKSYFRCLKSNFVGSFYSVQIVMDSVPSFPFFLLSIYHLSISPYQSLYLSTYLRIQLFPIYYLSIPYLSIYLAIICLRNLSILTLEVPRVRDARSPEKYRVLHTETQKFSEQKHRVVALRFQGSTQFSTLRRFGFFYSPWNFTRHLLFSSTGHAWISCSLIIRKKIFMWKPQCIYYLSELIGCGQ